MDSEKPLNPLLRLITSVWMLQVYPKGLFCLFKILNIIYVKFTQ